MREHRNDQPRRMPGIALALGAAAAVICAAALRSAPSAPARTAWATAAVLATLIAWTALWLTFIGECESDGGPPRPLAWQWSPRREFCDDAFSPAALGASGLMLAAPAAVTAAGFLWRRRRLRVLAAPAVAAAALVPFAFAPYVTALPYYRFSDTHVLYDPLLRGAAAGQPPRVYYRYGIYEAVPQTAASDRRVCMDLADTPEAHALTGAYDEGETVYQLHWVAVHLSARGLPVETGETGVPGLIVARSYRLPEAAARAGAVDLSP